MRKRTGLLLLCLGALVGAWVAVQGQTPEEEILGQLLRIKEAQTPEAPDVQLIREVPGRFEIVSVGGVPKWEAMFLLDTTTGQTWGMRGGKHWEELPRTKAP